MAGSQIAQNISDLEYPLIRGIGMMCYKERHLLLLKCFITFLRCIRKNGGAFDSIYKPLIVHTVSFISRLTLKLHTKWQIWDTLSAWKMGQYTTRRCIHCCWSGSYHLLDTQVRRDELLIASTSPLLFNLCHFHWGWLSNCTQNTRFGVPSLHGKWGDMLWGEVSIAAGVFHNLP